MIEKLFTSKTRTKILELFLFSKKEYNMREVERKLKIPVSAVKREIDNLNNISILKKENNKYKVNERCTFIDSLIDIFIKTDSFKFELEESLRGLNANFVFVFGSFANNDYNAESDIDLFIIGKISMSKIIQSLKSIEQRLGREINPIVWSIDKLKDSKDKSFIRDIAKKKILMIIGKENELRKII
jgi:predicted nucleotidyltransferase